MTSNNFNLFNVASLCNYENRLYIANYDESDYNVNLKNYAANIRAKMIYEPCSKSNTTNTTTKEYEIYTFSWSTNAISPAIVEVPKPSNNTIVNVDRNKITYHVVLNARDYNELKRYLCFVANDNENVSDFDNLALGGYKGKHLFPCSNIAFGVKDDGTFDIISIPVMVNLVGYMMVLEKVVVQTINMQV